MCSRACVIYNISHFDILPVVEYNKTIQLFYKICVVMAYFIKSESFVERNLPKLTSSSVLARPLFAFH